MEVEVWHRRINISAVVDTDIVLHFRSLIKSIKMVIQNGESNRSTIDKLVVLGQLNIGGTLLLTEWLSMSDALALFWRRNQELALVNS